MPQVLIDTHTHVVAADRVRYPQRDVALANGAWWEGVDCSVESLAADVAATPVDGVVLVQAVGPYGDDNTYLVDALVGRDDAFVGAVVVDPTGTDPLGRLAALADHSSVRGIRLFHVPTPAEPWLDGPEGDRLVDAAAELELCIAVCCMPDSLGALGRQLTRRPDLAMVLDHCGFADLSGGPPYERAAPLWALADQPNVHLKLTPTCVEMSGADPAGLLQLLVDRFGAERLVWGSDWPQHRAAPTYAEQVTEITAWLDVLGAAERELVAGRNAERLWPDAWAGRSGVER